MRLRARQHGIVCRRLVFKVVRLHIVLAHGMVFEAVPHQNPPQIRMAGKDDPEEVEDFALLELRRAPDRRQRRQLDLIGAVDGAHAKDERPMLPCHRIEVIDRFKESGLDALAGLFNGFLDCWSLPSDASTVFVTVRVTFTFSAISLSGQSTPVTLERKSKASSASSRRNVATSDSVFRRQPQRVLRRRAGIGHNLHPRARNRRLNRRLDLFHRLQNSS